MNNELFCALVRFGNRPQQCQLSLNCTMSKGQGIFFLMLAIPATSKWIHLVEEVVEHHVRQKWAHTLCMVSEFLDDLSSSDAQANADISELSSSLSLLSPSPSSASSLSSSISSSSNSLSHHLDDTHLGHISSDSEDFEDKLPQRWDAQVQALVTFLLTSQILDARPPVKKLGQLILYLSDYQHDHPHLFQKRLRVSPLIFDCLVELIKDHNIFHNNTHCPQHPPHVQLAIFLLRVGHYGNASSPEYVAQWAGVSVGTVINVTYCCLIAFLALHDKAVMMPPEEEKERAKEYMEHVTCPEWRNGFLLADGMKFTLFQKPGLHGEAWFDKNKNYSINCQVRAISFGIRIEYLLLSRSSVCPKIF